MCFQKIFFIVFGTGHGNFLAAYSGYLNPLFGGIDPKPIIAEDMTLLRIILQISLVLVLVIVVLIITLCVLHRYSKRVQHQGEEIITLRNSFRYSTFLFVFIARHIRFKQIYAFDKPRSYVTSCIKSL